jgi:hypothetical protein
MSTTRRPAGSAAVTAAGGEALVLAAAGALAALALAGAPAGVAGQELARRVADAGPAHSFSFPSRPGVCGAGDGILVRESDGSTMFLSGRWSRDRYEGLRTGEEPCETGEVVVTGRVRTGGGYDNVDLDIRSRPATGAGYLGSFSAAESARFLLDAARRSDGRTARDLILAAALADAETWPGLLELARDRSLARSTRRSAIHWLGRRAAREAADALGGIVRDRTEDDEIREAAVFGLSQLPDDEGVPILIDLARTSRDARVRSRALFWLADSEDPRALSLFEEILTGG